MNCLCGGQSEETNFTTPETDPEHMMEDDTMTWQRAAGDSDNV